MAFSQVTDGKSFQVDLSLPRRTVAYMSGVGAGVRSQIVDFTGFLGKLKRVVVFFGDGIEWLTAVSDWLFRHSAVDYCGLGRLRAATVPLD